MERNLNDIIPPSRRRAMLGEGAAFPQAPEGEPSFSDMQPPARPPRPGMPERPSRVRTGRRFPMGTAIIAGLVVLVSIGALFAFSGAKVAVVPAMSPASVNEGAFVATLGAGDLPYQLITVEKEATKQVDAESTETVNQPAQGAITITNLQAAPQQLIKNTRFESADGHIFRIRDSITVPAAKGTVPGTLDVTVYADAAGESYNIGATTFTVPGLKGSAAFEQVTAKSGGAMAGGFVGQRPTVGQATRDREYAALQSGLAADISKAMADKLPEGYVLVPGASFTTYTPSPDQPATGGKVVLAEKATTKAVVFPNDALAKAIAFQAVGTYAGQPLTLKDTGTLRLTSATGQAPSEADQEFAFTLSGDTTVIWTVDASKIAAAVAGKSRDAAKMALTGFPEVDTAALNLKPFWAGSFPADPEKITVTVEEPGAKK